MFYFATGTDPLVTEAMRAGIIGRIDQPNVGTEPEPGVRWCLDNGAFSDNWREAKWRDYMLRRRPLQATCEFAVAPDVVADADATLLRSLPWLPILRVHGYSPAYVAQDGARPDNLPWAEFDTLFIGGSDRFKLGPDTRVLVREALDRGHRIHFGRVNSQKRYEYARALGCHSADGTILRFGPRPNLIRVLKWLDHAEDHPTIGACS